MCISNAEPTYRIICMACQEIEEGEEDILVNYITCPNCEEMFHVGLCFERQENHECKIPKGYL